MCFARRYPPPEDYRLVAQIKEEKEKVILSANWLENRNFNITKQLACYSPELAKDIFETFEDFRLVQQIREEIKTLNYLKLLF